MKAIVVVVALGLMSSASFAIDSDNINFDEQSDAVDQTIVQNEEAMRELGKIFVASENCEFELDELKLGLYNASLSPTAADEGVLAEEVDVRTLEVEEFSSGELVTFCQAAEESAEALKIVAN